MTYFHKINLLGPFPFLFSASPSKESPESGENSEILHKVRNAEEDQYGAGSRKNHGVFGDAGSHTVLWSLGGGLTMIGR